MNKIGLVTVLYNSDSVLEGFFKSLSVQVFIQYHLYIVDNSPSDTTTRLIEQLVQKYPVPAFTHICNSKNEGVAKGNNIGIERAVGEGCSHVLLLNNDIEFYQEFLLGKILLLSLSRNEPLVIPKIFFYGTKKIWMAGGRLAKYSAVTYHVGEGDADGEKYNTPAHFYMAPTCFMLIEKSVFEQVGLMDEKYFVYYDDSDFVYRAVSKGYKVFYAPALEVFHKVSSSTGGRASVFAIYYWNRNRILFVKKNMKLIYKAVVFPYLFCATSIKIFLYNSAQRKAMLKGIKDGFAL